MATPESDFKRQLRKYLDDRGIYYTNVQGGFGVAPGAPDMILCVEGHFIAFESKTYKGRQSDDQRIHQAKIEASGGKYHLVRTMAEAIAIIDDITSRVRGV